MNVQLCSIRGDQHQIDIVRFLLVADAEDTGCHILGHLDCFDDRPLFLDAAAARPGNALMEDIPVVIKDGVGVFLRHLDDGHEWVLPRLANKILAVHLCQATPTFSAETVLRVVANIKLGLRPRVVNRRCTDTRCANALGVPVPF